MHHEMMPLIEICGVTCPIVLLAGMRTLFLIFVRTVLHRAPEEASKHQRSCCKTHGLQHKTIKFVLEIEGFRCHGNKADQILEAYDEDYQ